MTISEQQVSHVAVIGGGMLGLSLALYLAKAGRQVTVFEAGKSVGGMAGAAEYGGYTWDRFYHVILMSDSNMLGLLEELNLKQKDLVGVIGGKSRVSEILNRKKRLTVDMIRELERILQISASVLVNNYKLAPK